SPLPLILSGLGGAARTRAWLGLPGWAGARRRTGRAPRHGTPPAWACGRAPPPGTAAPSRSWSARRACAASGFPVRASPWSFSSITRHPDFTRCESSVTLPREGAIPVVLMTAFELRQLPSTISGPLHTPIYLAELLTVVATLID